MSIARALYRTRQFRNALRRVPTQEEMELAKRFLPPSLLAAFITMQPNEQAHSLDVLQKLLAQGETNPGLLSAALLHDLGKTVSPLRIWERVLIVLVQAFSPSLAKQFGLVLRWRPFLVAELHPDWGAELAERAGASPLSVVLIRRHQEPLAQSDERVSGEPDSEDDLLRRLQAVDDQS